MGQPPWPPPAPASPLQRVPPPTNPNPNATPPAEPTPDRAVSSPNPSVWAPPDRTVSSPDAPVSSPDAPVWSPVNARLAPNPAPVDALAEMARLRQEIAKVVVGQHGVVSGLLAALLVGGHVLLEGVPGVAKTLLVKTLATAMDLQFGRVQFTPDLMPADLTGQMVLDSAGGLRFRPGPVFTNLLLADEINRTPPKTQAALLEAMEEHQVSSDGLSRPLPDPFLVVATQNPIEYEGTYPLPEAQLDRFLFKLPVDYPSAEEELELLARHHRGLDPRNLPSLGVAPVMNATTLALARSQARAVTVEPVVLQYVVALTRATRDAPSSQLGASPRATVALLAAAKAWAWMSGRSYLSPEEVKATFKPVLRHRVTVRPEVALDGLNVESLLDRVLASVPSPR